MSRPSAPWWSSYFDEDFLRIYGALLPPERTRREVDAILEILDLHSGSRILDLACGWGRHALELTRAGHRVAAVDLSPRLLEAGRTAAADDSLRVDWVRADCRALPFRGSFDAALSLFSSLGYFLDDEVDLAVLRGVREVLRPEGRFLLETMHRDLIAREYAERDWWEGPDGEHVWVEREFDAIAGVSHEVLRWRRGGETGEKRHALRVRSATEWQVLLERAGLEPLEWFGSWDLEPLGHTSPRLIVVARRRADGLSG